MAGGADEAQFTDYDADMAAVKQDGVALRHVKTQTPELCTEAVKQNGWALYYVKTQTPELCVAARQSIASKNYHRHKEMIAALETRLPRDVAKLVMEFAQAKPFTT